MTLIINKCFNTRFQPDDFTMSIFIQLPKIDDTKECAEHRASSLISHAAMILLRTLKRKMAPLAEKEWVKISCFREDRGTRDAICKLRIFGEEMISKNKKIFACFIDQKKHLMK